MWKLGIVISFWCTPPIFYTEKDDPGSYQDHLSPDLIEHSAVRDIQQTALQMDQPSNSVKPSPQSTSIEIT